jgi:sulfur-oxidizing protein SoxZ
MANAVKVRTKLDGDVALIRLLISHPMETGCAKIPRASGARALHRAAHHHYQDRTVLSAQWGPAVSRNPYLAFRFKGAQKGEKIKISWLDSIGRVADRRGRTRMSLVASMALAVAILLAPCAVGHRRARQMKLRMRARATRSTNIARCCRMATPPNCPKRAARSCGPRLRDRNTRRSSSATSDWARPARGCVCQTAALFRRHRAGTGSRLRGLRLA